MTETARKSGKRLIDWAFLALLVAASPFFMFPRLEYIWIFLVFPFLLFLRLAAKKSFLVRSPLDLALAILFFQVAINSLISPDLAFSLPKIMGALFGLLTYYALLAVLDNKMLIFLATIGFLGMGTILAVGGVMGMTWGPESFFSKMMAAFSRLVPKIAYRLPGAEAGINPNPLGGTLLWFIPLAFVFLLSFADPNTNFPWPELKAWGFVFFLFSLYFMLTALFLTQAVGAWAGLILTTGIFLLIKKSWSTRLAGILVLFSFFLLFSNGWFLGKKNASASGNLFHQKIEARIPQWKTGLEAIKSHPFFGVGMNRLRLNPAIGYSGAHAHNHLIHTAAELGIPALVAYMAILAGAGWMCFQVARRAKEGWMRPAALGLGAGQLAHFFFGLADSIPLGAKPGIFFWISLALLAAMYNLIISEEKNRVA